MVTLKERLIIQREKGSGKIESLVIFAMDNHTELAKLSPQDKRILLRTAQYPESRMSELNLGIKIGFKKAELPTYEPKHKAGHHYYLAGEVLRPTDRYLLIAVMNNIEVASSTINKVELARLIALGYEPNDKLEFFVTYELWQEAVARNYQLKDEYIAKHKLEIK